MTLAKRIGLRRVIERLYASVVSDKRPYPAYSWGWLNRLAERLFWENRGASIRPQYAWGAVFAAAQARALGLAEVSLIEFGVAGGRGLLALEEIAASVSSAIGVRASVLGFDTGRGLPEVRDVRDLPQLYKGGDYRMDVAALKARLTPTTELVIGDVRQTLVARLKDPHPAIGFVSIDVDYYSSAQDAFELFRADTPLTHCLPRVVCYLDDIMGVTFSDLTGERLAMREFNSRESPSRCVSPVYGLRYHLNWPHSRSQWPDMMYWAHFLDHPNYGIYDGLTPVAHAPLD